MSAGPTRMRLSLEIEEWNARVLSSDLIVGVVYFFLVQKICPLTDCRLNPSIKQSEIYETSILNICLNIFMRSCHSSPSVRS